MGTIAFDAGTITADLKLNRSEFTKGLETARRQAERFSKTPLEKKIKVSTTVNKRNFQQLTTQLESFRKSTFRAAVGLDIDSQERGQFSAMRNNLAQFDRKVYSATARVNTNQANKNVRRLGDTISGYFAKVAQRGFRTSLVSMAAFRTAGSAAITAIIPAFSAATAAAGGLVSTLGTAALGAAAFGAVAVPQIKAVTDAIEDGKVQFSELNAELHPLGRAVQSVMDAFNKLQDATRGAVSAALVSGAEALAALLPTLKPLIDSTAAAFQRMGEALTSSFQTKGFRNFIQFLADNVGPVMDKLFAIVVNLARGIGGLMQAFMPLGTGLLDSIANGMKRFAQWAQNLGNNKSFQQFLAYANQALPVMWQMVKNVVGAFIAFGKALDGIGLEVAKGISRLFEIIKNTDPAMLAAVAMGLSAVVAAIGIGLGPAAIVAAGGIAAMVGAFSNLKGGIEVLSGPLQRIVGFFQDVWAKITQVAQSIWNQVQPSLQQLWQMIQTQLIPAFANFLDAVKPVVMWFIDFMKPIITSVIKSVINILKGFVKIITGIFKTLTGILTGDWGKAWEGIKQIVSGAIQVIWNFLKIWILGRIVKIFRGGIRLFRNIFTRGFNAIRNFVMKIWSAIVSWLTKRLNSFKNFWKGVWDTIWGTIKGIWNGIWTTIKNVWNNLTSWFSSAFNKYITRWRQGWKQISDFFGNIFGGIVRTAKSVWDDVVSAFKTGINAVTGVVNRWFLAPINKVLGVFDLKIPTIPKMATGGKLGNEVDMMASGGSIGGGFKTNKPKAIVGEGNTSKPEYVIPTDPRHRGRARALHAEAGKQLMENGGIVGGQTQMMADGGILGWLGDLGSSAWKGIKSVGSGIAWLGQKSWDLIKQGAGWVMDNSIQPIVSKVKQFLPQNILGDVGRGSIDKAYGGIRDFLRSKEDEVKSAGESFQKSSRTAGARPAQEWAPVASQALSMLGMPASWLGATLRQIQIESGGNPNAINNWDINAQMGMPSQGLLQTIPPTFYANALPGFGNITAPLDNILAALRYTVGRYGSVPNIWPTRAGYDNGGGLQPGWNMAYNGTGQVENVRSPQTEDAMIRKLDEIARLLSEQEGGVNFNIGQASPDTVNELLSKAFVRLRHRRKEQV